MQTAKSFIHFTGFSIWDWDTVLGCREFEIYLSCVHSPHSWESTLLNVLFYIWHLVMPYFTFRMSRKEADIEIEHKKVLLNFKIFFLIFWLRGRPQTTFTRRGWCMVKKCPYHRKFQRRGLVVKKSKILSTSFVSDSWAMYSFLSLDIW